MIRMSLISCRLFLLALVPSVCLAAPAPHVPASTCMASATASGAPTLPASDINYPAINQALMTPDANQRLSGLSQEIRRLDQARAPEAGLVRHRLQLALAQTQSSLGLNLAAMTTLKRLPVSSPQAPEALVLLAELEAQNNRPKAAVRWLRQLADLFPEEPLAVHALWRAAELNYPHSRHAIALWQQAAHHADEALASAQSWHARSQEPDFIDKLNSEKLSPELWRIARKALMNPAFAGADNVQTELRQQLQCLTANQDALLRRLQANPRLLSDLNETVGTLTAQLQAARSDMENREKVFQTAAQEWKECQAKSPACGAEQARHDQLGRELTGWRNRLQSIERKLAFLREEEKLMDTAGQQSSAGDLALQLNQRLSSTRIIMQKLVQQSLASAVQDWEALSAEAHFRLAEAQEPRIYPSLAPSHR